jgi:hypothetical protein
VAPASDRIGGCRSYDPWPKFFVKNGNSISQASITARRFPAYLGQIRNAKKGLFLNANNLAFSPSGIPPGFLLGFWTPFKLAYERA